MLDQKRRDFTFVYEALDCLLKGLLPVPSFHVSDENLSKTNVRAALQDVVTKFMDVRS